MKSKNKSNKNKKTAGKTSTSKRCVGKICTSKSTSTSKTCTGKIKSQQITKRIVDARRHTQGYIVGGKEVSVPQARKLAAAGRLRGVQVVGQHIQSLPGKKRLSELPMMIKK